MAAAVHETIRAFHSLWIYTMNRCSRRSLLALCAAATATAALSLPAHAQALSRPFPKEALRGTLVMTQPPYLTMDDREGRLSPGARIRNTNNNVVRPASLVQQPQVVNYTIDGRGQVRDVWILTAEEAKEKRAGFGVQRNFSFESQQQSASPGTATPGSATPATQPATSN